MGLRPSLGNFVAFLYLYGICGGSIPENCTNVPLQIEKVFSVPGQVAMLNSTLASSYVFNISTIPYNITWYRAKTGQEMSNQTGRIIVLAQTLWILNIKMEDDGEYVTILRTPTWCYRQATKLIVEEPVTSACEKPRKADQILMNGVTDVLSCPLHNYVKKLDSYGISSSITWHRGCDLIKDGTGKFTYWDKKLKIDNVDTENKGLYTCTLNFTLDGFEGSVSETINATVKVEYDLVPQVHEPANEIIKAEHGSSFRKMCRVFVPSVGTVPDIDIFWLARGRFVSEEPSDRVHMAEQGLSYHAVPGKGVWFQRLLKFSRLMEEDFHINYTCRAHSDRGNPEGYFTLLPADPNIILPVGLVLITVKVLFASSIIIYYLFKIDIILWVRRAFPFLYTNKDLDGKLYDAYVVYPQQCEEGFSEDIQTFALHVLPQVLEAKCGYKLFIAGRDCVPGQSVMESVEENIQASRRLLLLYDASTFMYRQRKSRTSCINNNISQKNSESEESNTNESGTSCIDTGDGGGPDVRQQLECIIAMHRVLLEGTLKVVLVEMEEMSPAQLALLPESVRYLRKCQGAVCWWKNRRTRRTWRTCVKGKEEEDRRGAEAELSPFLSSSSNFWKELKYHMPVRGKRAVYPSKTALLNV
ncbi:LOW QUALITY PROTEIN: interleukin-1 receptor type 1 [Thalassophryne amazonica]|uniref:LOW QUALITY PROTEIN: interleukin-1 receptor type 1 n=1 Tax=Thalassophryne amazonica TaxID=390379 RepID=UPI0014718041|nr:LOW QUALITY PROTEIN: interleukin-1 receptor type 1 [Thalassophryne amazonica]